MCSFGGRAPFTDEVRHYFRTVCGKHQCFHVCFHSNYFSVQETIEDHCSQLKSEHTDARIQIGELNERICEQTETVEQIKVTKKILYVLCVYSVINNTNVHLFPHTLLGGAAFIYT